MVVAENSAAASQCVFGQIPGRSVLPQISKGGSQDM